MTTRKQIKIRKKTNELIDDACKFMKKKLNERVMICGAIDWENVEDNYVIPKEILCALLKECESQYCWLANKKNVNNIYNQI